MMLADSWLNGSGLMTAERHERATTQKICERPRHPSQRTLAAKIGTVVSTEWIIEYLTTATSYVHVSDPDAYDKFAEGKMIFDISEGPLDEFVAKLEPEFGASIVRRQPFEFSGIPIYAVHHKHKTREVEAAELGKLEDETLLPPE